VYKHSHTLIEDRSACVKWNRDRALWRAESVRLLNADIQMCEWRGRDTGVCLENNSCLGGSQGVQHFVLQWREMWFN